MKKYPVTLRNKVKRIPDRGHYDKKTLYSILDAGFVAHVSFVLDDQPFVIPMAYGRKGEKIYIHGATSSRLIKSIKTGIPVCLCVTHLDGVVFARSVFHSSLKYRSAVVFGTATEVAENRKNSALKVISDQIAKGRWEEARLPNKKELKATSILELKIDQASSKIRTGGPKDEKEDYDLPIWAGVIPLRIVSGKIQSDAAIKKDVKVSESARKVRKVFS